MPSFDVVSEVDWQEVRNAVDQANREIGTRYDFKGTDAKVEQKDQLLIVHADEEFQVDQALEILRNKLAKRKVDLDCLDVGKIETVGSGKARQEIKVRDGIEQDLGKQLVKTIKASKIKVQASIQGNQVRVSGKKRDDLQSVIEIMRKEKVGLPLQFVNFRD